MNYRFLIGSIIIILSISGLKSQQKQYQAATVGFYNVENLFDIYKSVDLVNKKLPFTSEFQRISMTEEEAKQFLENQKKSADSIYDSYIDYQILNDEFTPEGKKGYGEEKYNRKQHNLASVISKIGRDFTKNAPVIMGLVEVENRKVLEDLISQPELASYNYGIVHYNSNDKRGIDVALIYQKKRFELIDSKRYIVDIPAEEGEYKDITRDILRVSGLLDGENFTFIVNHWPSRRGGEAASEHKRAIAARVMKQIFDEVQSKNPNEKIISMGDFNDDPISPSFTKVLKAEGNPKKLNPTSIYNPMEKIFKKGGGTLAYRDSWNVFDMQLLSANLVSNDMESYKVHSTQIYSADYLISPTGQYKGYPRRSFGGDTFDEDGYSDHFPVYSILLKEIQ